ncbi:MAG: hypothetical protein WCO25_03865 [Candidatus Uhrbacteria bacterium]
MRGFVKAIVLYVIPVMVAVGLIAYLILRTPSVEKAGEKLRLSPDPVDDETPAEPVDTSKLDRASQDLVLGCTTDMATTFHIHPFLTVFVNDVRVPILPGVGIEEGKCMHPIHTHDATGKIHVESPKPANFTLGDFFLVWGKKFDELGTLEKMTVNGTDSTEGENLILIDHDKIVLRYTTAGG